MNKKLHKSISKFQRYIPSSWMDPAYSSIDSVFAKPDSFDSVSTNVCLTSYWGIVIPLKNKGYVISMVLISFLFMNVISPLLAFVFLLLLLR